MPFPVADCRGCGQQTTATILNPPDPFIQKMIISQATIEILRATNDAISKNVTKHVGHMRRQIPLCRNTHAWSWSLLVSRGKQPKYSLQGTLLVRKEPRSLDHDAPVDDSDESQKTAGERPTDDKTWPLGYNSLSLSPLLSFVERKKDFDEVPVHPRDDPP